MLHADCPPTRTTRCQPHCWLQPTEEKGAACQRSKAHQKKSSERRYQSERIQGQQPSEDDHTIDSCSRGRIPWRQPYVEGVASEPKEQDARRRKGHAGEGSRQPVWWT